MIARRAIEPGDLDPAVLDRIVGSWSTVKKPTIVTFVVDVSGSMSGKPLEQVQSGLNHLVDALASADDSADGNQVGMVTFSSSVLKF